NAGDDPMDVVLELPYGSDFAGVREAQDGGNGAGGGWQETTQRSVTLWHDRDGYRRGTVLTFGRAGRVTKQRATFRFRRAANQEWSVCVEIVPIVDGKKRKPLLRCNSFHEHAHKMPMSLEEWQRDSPDIETDDRELERTYHQSLLDLAALRVRPDDVKIKWAMPGGGLPWFMTIFGRDSLIAAYEAIPFHQELAQATLEALAELQATDWDNFRDAEP